MPHGGHDVIANTGFHLKIYGNGKKHHNNASKEENGTHRHHCCQANKKHGKAFANAFSSTHTSTRTTTTTRQTNIVSLDGQQPIAKTGSRPHPVCRHSATISNNTPEPLPFSRAPLGQKRKSSHRREGIPKEGGCLAGKREDKPTLTPSSFFAHRQLEPMPNHPPLPHNAATMPRSPLW
uniref:Uncharacterized protein n=1 Tax=Leersia perrieri TaxID=77586 RepID=A0A0D9XY98_9ORYZ